MEDFLWVEKYRPKTISECVLPSGLKQTLSEFISKGDLPNMILSGGPGVGKTTIARLLAEHSKSHFEQLSAIFTGVSDLKKVFEAAKIRRTNGH